MKSGSIRATKVIEAVSRKFAWHEANPGRKLPLAIVRAKRRARTIWPRLALAATLGVAANLGAQVSSDLEQGIKPFGSYHGGSLDSVSLSNGNLFFHADLLSYSQRGGELAYPIVLQYNNENYSTFVGPVGCSAHGGVPCQTYVVFNADPNDASTSLGAAVSIAFEGPLGLASSSVNTGLSLNTSPISVDVTSVQTPDGSLHQLVNTGNGSATTDGSGFYLDSSGATRDRNGSKFNAGNFPPSGSIEDANGNQLTASGSAWKDTLGRTIPIMPGPVHPADTPPASTAGLSACPALGYANQPVSYAYTWNLPTVNGGTLPLTLCYSSVWVHSNFFNGLGNGPKQFDVNQNFTMLQSVVFPDNTYWAFAYDAAVPNNSSSYGYGDLLQIRLPTGGSISYTWANIPGCLSVSQNIHRAVTTRTVNANDGSGGNMWTYAYSGFALVNNNPAQTVTVTDPLKNDTVHTITGLGGPCNLYETEVQNFQGSKSGGTLLKTVTTDYQFALNPYDSNAISSQRVDLAHSITSVFPIRVTTTLPNGLVRKVETDYDSALAYHGPLDGISNNELVCASNGAGGQSCNYSTPTTMPVTNYTGSYGKVIATREFDWGNGAPGGLLRETFTTYQWQANNTYLTPNNFLDLAATNTVCSPLAGSESGDSTGCTDPNFTLKRRAQTTYGYDEYGLNPSGVGAQFNTNPVDGSIRGNRTSVHRWLNGSTTSTTNCPISVSNGFLVSYAQYNDTGTVNKTTDTCGASAGDPNHTTTFSYSSTFAGAYATLVTNPLGQKASTNYDFNTGLELSQTDVNNQTTTFSHDSTWRTIEVDHPDQGQTKFCYTDTGGATCSQGSAPFKVVVTKKIDTGRNTIATALLDGLGRKTETQLNSDPVCTSKVDTGYDALGRVATVTNPFCSTSDSTYGVTTTGYDALGRVAQVIHPDGTAITTLYTGRAVQVSDEGNGTRTVERISQSDGLGRLASVCEVSSTTLSVGSGATPAACNLDIAATGFLTSYSYDTLSSLTGVSQGGYMPRSFTYDSLSRLLAASNPESGLISYTYDAAGNVITKTDARGIIITYAYDKLHRLLSKSYSDGTPTATFVYDSCPSGGCPTGVSPQLTVGRVVEASVPNAQTFYSYDPLGRVLNQWQCTPVNCGTGFYALSYGYDLAGDTTSSSNGFGVTLSHAYDTAMRLTGVTSNLSDANHPANLLSNVQYNVLGLPKAETLGNNVTEALAYDTRLRLTSLTAASPTAVGATAGGASVSFSGNEQSKQVQSQAATAATGSVTISGTEKSVSVPNCVPTPDLQCPPHSGSTTVYDSGTVSVTINGTGYSCGYGQGDTTNTIASCLASTISGGSLASATPSGATVSITAKASGAGSNYSLSASYAYDTVDFSGPSFTTGTSGSALTGGQDAIYQTVYNAGTLTVTISGHSISPATSWGQGSTAASIASDLNSKIQADGGSPVNSSVSGSTVSLTAKTVGASSNYSVSCSVSYDSADFSSSSFSSSCPSALTGGHGPTPGTVYSVGLGYAPNSNVLSANDSANGNWSYGYDDFNRLLSSNKNSGQQTYSYVHDRFGNRWQQNAPQGGSVFLGSFNGGNNRLDSASHDAAGNMAHDPTTGANYSFDAESRITQVNGGAGSGGVTYTYDAEGQRVEKNVGGTKTDYVYDPEGHAIVELNGSGAVNREELFAGGKHLGTYVNGTTYFSHGDGLGTERVRSDMTGAACENIQSLPYGDGQSTTGSCGDPSTRHFTGKERDSETGLDYFGARYYSNGLGRFITPDWSSTPIPVPYADLGDPQTLNQYSYVRNIPTVKVDADGHDGCCTLSDLARLVDEGYEAGKAMIDALRPAAPAAPAAGAALATVGPAAVLALPSAGAMTLVVVGPKFELPADGNGCGGDCTLLPYIYTGANQQTQTQTQNGQTQETEHQPEPQVSTSGAGATQGPNGPYKRPNNATTQAQRDSVQGQPCVTCGKNEGQKNNANHIDPLVEQHYRDGIDLNKMRSPGAVNAQCQSCSNQQGGLLRTFGQAMKKLFGF